MKEIAIITCHGGVEFSSLAIEKLTAVGLPTEEIALLHGYYDEETKEIQEPAVKRDDPRLVGMIKELGYEFTTHGTMIVIEIPDDVEWEINDYDGDEWVAEVHRRWGEKYGVGPFKPPQ